MHDPNSTSPAGVQPSRPSNLIPVHRWLLAAGLMFLNLLDVVSTKIVLGLGGSESNPLMVDVMNHPTYPWLTKVGICLAIAVLLFAAPTTSKRADRAVGLVMLFYVGVVGWNISLIVRHYLG